MIEITKDADFSALLELGIEPEAAGDDIFYYTAREKGEALCCCRCKYSGDFMRIIDIYAKNDDILNLYADSVIRAAMNGADLKGINTVYCHNTAMKRWLDAIGFEEDGAGYKIGLAGFFTEKH